MSVATGLHVDAPRVETGSAPGNATPVRVLHLVPQLRTGGMEQGVVKLLNGLPADRIVSSICSFEERIDGIVDLIDRRVTIHRLGRRAGNDPRLVWRLMRLIRQTAPDIVHSHSWGTLCEGYVAARAARIPCFVHGEHGTMDVRPRNVRVQRWVWRRADRVLAVSERLADRMAQIVGFPRNRIHVIVNGADMRRFGSVARGEARKSLGLADDALVVGTIGRLVPVKDHATLLAALAALRDRGHAPVMLFVGDGPLRDALEDRTRALGLRHTVRFLGHRGDTERVLAAMDIFVLSSTSEGLPNTVLEAMASGLPVVSTHVGGVDELVEHGTNGLLVPAANPAALADAIRQLVSDPAQRHAMGIAGRSKALAEFQLERMLDGYERLYATLVRRSATRTPATQRC